ncbi:DUF3445 domain-containing protein [Desertifilum sp. FACHB-1129]|uniref:DUF3445 domain-containing protein n=2 Tax=Desertifilum tharense IPPAS B-1220 TaxID=1781255 RepID=A0A1E5QI22_9CYAN|nr:MULTISPECIES: DUF3445 domain-containing protein [Desertifilum]MDA0211355.1 DUF3445 domain-containing protein [Cyanobacteria bacterium FC1]MBD2313990.1 DUF3445 domain-containing protein [Desertifilum sp. FACHB-1129]MBD2320316.1 DUF3445 domain-containing protein [Desertifilum sp. FACHB-866]MBD2330444.1 DUF3445 domain-containing protein [Desertifilum sp. FACHB-868]OEJ74244.1 hypothetical protein BH720_15695 [Desertifilum tharense IPPAS B-1220]
MHFPFTSGKWQLKLGVQPLDLKDWIQIDSHFQSELDLKEQLTRSHPSEVFGSLPQSLESQRETLSLLIEHLLTHFPQIYHVQGNLIQNRLINKTWQIDDFDTNPLALAGRLVQEDFLILQPLDSQYCLTAASVCFPLRWKIAEKLGHPLAMIHQPVPQYQQKLANPVDNLFTRLSAENPVWRLNWSLVDTPELFLAKGIKKAESLPAITSENAGDRLWLRFEHQSMRRLPKTSNIVFGIHTYIEPLKILANFPEAAQGLASTVQQMPAEMQAYKSISPVRDALINYLNTL